MKKLPVILALDLDDSKVILDLVKETKEDIQTYKIGPRLFLKEGPSLLKKIKDISKDSQIFLDFKFHDIPSSTLSAVRSAFYIKADFVTVHAEVGLETLKSLYQLEQELKKERFFQILCVTVLSSQPASQENQNKVLSLAKQVYQSGLKGLVCSPHELKALRKIYPDFFIVTPGIRLEQDPQGDQKRVMTPLKALQAGSSALVMGRSLIEKKNPAQELKKLKETLFQV